MSYSGPKPATEVVFLHAEKLLDVKLTAWHFVCESVMQKNINYFSAEPKMKIRWIVLEAQRNI